MLAAMVIAASTPDGPTPFAWPANLDTRTGFLAWLGRVRVVPVVRAEDAADALAVSEALIAGGLRAIEVTLTVPNADRVMAKLAGRPGVTVGAGSVCSRQDAERAIDAGARFIVSPACVPEALEVCLRRDVPCVMGALTPSEVVWAHGAGATAVKVFPISAVGGPAYLRAIRAPLPHVPLMATGGVLLADVDAYLKAGALAVGVGSELADVGAIRRGHADEVINAARALCVRLRQEENRP